ncbi:MAG: aspartate carbamoyltransferase regulatory subunit [Candidatus Kariarchaeaceae archaeon]|jgi:aspartate carbamoyltransferase regulatory subunit
MDEDGNHQFNAKVINMEKQMLVTKIDNGTVIDKIPAGKALQILRILKIYDTVEFTIAVAIRVDSRSLGTKDIVKMKDRQLSEDELKKIWLIAPNAKISRIEGYEVREQFMLQERQFNNKFTGVLTCNNPTCATNHREPVDKEFLLMQRDPILVRCLYCDRVMLESNIREQL